MDPMTTLLMTSTDMEDDGGSSGIGSGRELSQEYQSERDKNLQLFEKWTEPDQVDFIENLLLRMCHYQHGQINEFLTPMLQRDFISLLPSMLLLYKQSQWFLDIDDTKERQN